mmetsp:Transcript_8582/g.19256  ORF Transcript_8582/g.19256 Transcript_8582/m.19256 type:complete len:467 (-) Transcript_8582:196-1596(-)|eukprot:CAMPEP_0172316986 /NCGR_PEP_ID=MMETSP1058-20130122/30181_1 /TAXON_ID=83371 /ORGANISM="Detonula confervacea, Strain CCMP 353" /LENGTH=466 /DNA_ID=CAMNT_0013031429 /DNA_START=37 /DNA_END=1437 /DNA_ORIENTATION=+
MVSTRAMSARASLADEKKDEDYFVRDNRPPQSAAVDDDIMAHTTRESVEQKKRMDNESNNSPNTKKSPLLLLLCASGITSCYLWYGTIQEHVFHMDNAENDEAEEGNNESITLFLLASGTFSSFLLAWIWTMVGPILLLSDKSKKSSNTGNNTNDSQAIVGRGRLNHPLIILTSLTYLTAMAASNESLHYVSYPTCVLAKSAKLIPTMIVGWIVDQWRSWNHRSGSGSSGVGAKNNHGSTKTINGMEWFGAALITIGILSFQYSQLHKQSNNNDEKEVKGDSPFGLALLGLSLCMDGFLGACQSVLKQKNERKDTTTTAANNIAVVAYRPPSAMETMLYINLYATLLLLPASHYAGQFHRGMTMMFSNSSTKSMLLLQLNLSASLGQVFIFLTIHHFSPLTCTTITTTRKFFTILLSVYKFGHVLDVWQWVSIGLVFCGLYLEIVAKLFEQHHGDENEDVGKKKQE